MIKLIGNFFVRVVGNMDYIFIFYLQRVASFFGSYFLYFIVDIKLIFNSILQLNKTRKVFKNRKG